MVAIGAGLFVGSGVVIGDTGPGAFITMRVPGPDYARAALGNWAGF
jgi:GABA permease